MTDDEISEILLPLMPLKDPYVFARAIAAAEREACAKVCEEACVQIGCTALEAEGVVRRTRNALAVAIRERSNAELTGSPALSASPRGLPG